MTAVLFYLLALIPFYLLGTIPSGHLLAKYKGVDLSNSGSGNVGATNVARTMGLKAGAVILAVDALKGAVSAVISSSLTSDPSFIAAASFACVSGHCFSIPGFFKGGKGVATSLGIFCVLFPAAAAIALSVFAVIFYFTGIVSAASLTGAFFAAAVSLSSTAPWQLQFAAVLIVTLVFIRHSQNIKRLWMGTEQRFKAPEDGKPYI